MMPHLAPTRFAPDALSLPPPAAPQAELHDGDLRVGWVTDRTIGFRGFATANEAAGAAWVAYGVVARRYAGQDRWRPSPVEHAPLTVVPAGDHAAICAGGRPIGVLCRPGTSPVHDDATFGFEIEVPPPADELRVRTGAYLAYRALRRSGVRWALWSPPIDAPRMASLARVDAMRGHAASGVGDARRVGRCAGVTRLAGTVLTALLAMALLAWFSVQSMGTGLVVGAIAAVVAIVALVALALSAAEDVASMVRRETGSWTRTLRVASDEVARVVPGVVAPERPATPV